MEKYFEVKQDSSLYADYFSYMQDYPKILSAIKEVREKFGIESDAFYPRKDVLRILPTGKDMMKFSNKIKNPLNKGVFKKNSEQSKMWVSLVKDINHIEKPKLFYYCALSGRWKERLFRIGEKLYCSIESEYDFPIPEFAIEMKASEFYRILEEKEL